MLQIEGMKLSLEEDESLLAERAAALLRVPAGEIREWTDAYNDATNVEGTVCRRMGQSGDYYGVLRGAANVGVPGMIIEHGFHTVPEMRGTAKTGELAKAWARADAEGIAEGFGFL